MVTGDLLDLWLYEGSKGLNYLKESKAYKLSDPYIHYVDHYETVKSTGIQIVEKLEEKKEQLSEKLGDLQQKIVLFYDDTTNFVGMLVKVMRERQDELIKYIKETYSNVQIFVKDSWMRLDFNKDGSVSMEDMRKNLHEFYEFLKNYDYIEATSRIGGNMYEKALKAMNLNKKSESQPADLGDEQDEDLIGNESKNLPSDKLQKEE